MDDLNPNASASQDGRRPIPGFDGRYEMDEQGTVYAMFPFRDWPIGRTIKNRVHPQGYVTTGLSQNGRSVNRTVHRLLMLTFRPIENSRHFDVNHIDGNKQNNDLSNLEWLTHKANIQHAHKVLDAWAANGPRGENTITAKLTESDVRQIRELSKAGKSQRDIGRQFGVTGPNISHIVRRKSWAHIK